MACQITYKEKFVQLNNMQFAGLIDLVIEIAERTAGSEELAFVHRMKQLGNEFWPGRGMDIDVDFPDQLEQKFWCRVFFDLARAIFDRQIGKQDYSFWQAQAIHQAYSTALLFRSAVRDNDRDWTPDSLDHREWDRFFNQKKT